MPAPRKKVEDPDGIFEDDKVVALRPEQQFVHRMLRPSPGVQTELDLRGTKLALADIIGKRYVTPRYKLQPDDVVLVKQEDGFHFARVWKLDHENWPLLVPMNQGA